MAEVKVKNLSLRMDPKLHLQMKLRAIGNEETIQNYIIRLIEQDLGKVENTEKNEE